MKSKIGQIIVFRNDRLGARIVSLVNAIRIAQDYDLDYVVHWPKAVDVGSNFNEPEKLFAKSFIKEHFIDQKQWRARRDDAVRFNVMGGQPNPERLRELITSGRDILIDQAFGVLVMRGEDEAKVARDFAAALNQISFSRELVPKMAEVARLLSGATAYHIRRGDLVYEMRAKNKPWPHKYVPDHFYRAHMRSEIAHGGKVILFSDDSPTIAEFREAFPGLLTLADILGDSDLHSGAQDMLELYAMSRCAKIIAPAHSAFSSTAADLGPTPKIEVVADLSESTLGAVYSEMLGEIASQEFTPEVEGEIGQNMAHVQAWAAANGRLKDLADAQSRLIANGMNISFVFPDLVRNRLELGEIEAAAAVIPAMASVELHNTRYYAEALALGSAAQFALGQQEDGLVNLVNAFSHEPDRRFINSTIGALMTTGLLNNSNFLPVPDEVLSLRQRKYASGGEDTAFAVFNRAMGLEGRRDVPLLGPLYWMWESLMSSNPGRRSFRSGGAEDYPSTPDRYDSPEGKGFALFLQGIEKPSVALAEASLALADDHPGSPLMWYFAAHLLWAARDNRALEALDRAMECQTPLPAVAAWGCEPLQRRGRIKDALRLAAFAAENLRGLANVQATYAALLCADGQVEAALAQVDVVNRLAPLRPDVAMTAAKAHDSLGRIDAAIAAFDRIQHFKRGTRKSLRYLADLYGRNGDSAREAELLASIQ